MAQEPKRYRVSGTDDYEDVHAFETDDRDRANEMRAIMGEDLKGVEMEERASAKPGFDFLD